MVMAMEIFWRPLSFFIFNRWCLCLWVTCCFCWVIDVMVPTIVMVVLISVLRWPVSVRVYGGWFGGFRVSCCESMAYMVTVRVVFGWAWCVGVRG